eukprot:scaffold602_cov298-Pinguiococcus_pyrenoidosus.AAC.48
MEALASLRLTTAMQSSRRRKMLASASKKTQENSASWHLPCTSSATPLHSSLRTWPLAQVYAGEASSPAAQRSVKSAGCDTLVTCSGASTACCVETCDKFPRADALVAADKDTRSVGVAM